jgi:hypothetical protein
MGEASKDIDRFIASSFKSVWALELLLHLWRSPDRYFPRGELVSTLSASDAVVSTSILNLQAAGLIAENEQGMVRFAPANPDVGRNVEAVEKLYRTRPNAVRRTIVHSANAGISAFADAFRLRGD